MRRGDVWLVDLDPVRGAEANKARPVIVVSNDGANTAAWRNRSGVVTVVPVTTATDRVYAFQVLIGTQGTGLRVESKAQAEQVRSVSVERIGKVVGRLPDDLERRLDDALRLHLALPGSS